MQEEETEEEEDDDDEEDWVGSIRYTLKCPVYRRELCFLTNVVLNNSDVAYFLFYALEFQTYFELLSQ